nr:hypothetical protein LTR18_007668 [Exophiala xenobiotica]
MPGMVRRGWPLWREFGLAQPKASTPTTDVDHALAKQQIIQEYGQEALQQSWLKTCAQLEKIKEECARGDTHPIPTITMDDIECDRVSPQQIVEMKRAGCFVVRNVVDPDETTALFQELKEYTTRNKGRFHAWPAESPSMYNLYNTPTQNALRTNPRQIRLMRWINELWHWSSSNGETSAEPLLYADGLRVRPAGSPFLGLGPHIDAGSLCRWADPSYRAAYRAIFSGRPEDHDAYDLETRQDADQTLFPGMAHSSVFRAFQGWTALTKTAPREGTILLYPNVSTVIAYVLLRPFFRAPEDQSLIMDPKAWKFDAEGTWFPGTFKPESQYLSDSSHPHLHLRDCLLHVPELQPGDTVWWHTDTCHAVDAEHRGHGDASVAYIAATPTTKKNSIYMRDQYKSMVTGQPPMDYLAGGVDESPLEGFQGFAANPEVFKRMMGVA